MKNLLDFFIQAGQLKRIERRGWIAHRIKKAETTADHIFRTTIMAWILNKQKDLNEEKVLKTALIHDLCEIYGGDETPYDPLLPEKLNFLSLAKTRKILEKWPKFTPQQKREKHRIKYKRELQGLNRLTKTLPASLREEIRQLWKDFEEGKTKEGRFVKQIDKMENFLQGMEYWKEQGKIHYQLWDRWAKEILDDKIILSFKEAINRKFFKAKKQGSDSEKFMDQALEFLINVGKLKRIKQRKWIIRGIKQSESVAQHVFRATIMAWVLAERNKSLDVKQVIKIVLIHDLCDLEGCHESLCDVAVIKNPNYIKFWERRKKLKEFPRLPKGERLKWFVSQNEKEKKCIIRLMKDLPKGTQEELASLRIDFAEGLTKEGRFVKQAVKAESLLQAMEYGKEYKKFPTNPWWVEIREAVDNPVLIELLKEIDKRFDEGK
jgi:putative hydrolases of HD superfamily